MANEISDNWYDDFFQRINYELWEKAIPCEVTKAFLTPYEPITRVFIAKAVLSNVTAANISSGDSKRINIGFLYLPSSFVSAWVPGFTNNEYQPRPLT